MQLADKVAVVTGAGRGIGKACALELARRGANLVLNDRPESPDLAGTAAEVQALGRSCVIAQADVFSREGCQQVMAAAQDAFPRVDILISCPALSRRYSFLEYDPDDFEAVVRGTLGGGFHMSQLFARKLVEQGGGGKIVFISSIQARMPLGGSVAYAAAKAGVNHMMRVISVELTPHRINVNAIEPGWIDTPGEHEAFGDKRLATEGKKLPWGRLGAPEDIGKAAAYLVSPDADYMTGTIVRVDGGFMYKDCLSPELLPSQNP